MPKVASLPTQHRFHKLVWGDKPDTSGLIVGGSDQGLISVYDAGKLIGGGGEGCLVMSKDKHMGPVGALDFNPFQSNLVASGASESEIFIWDMNKPGTMQGHQPNGTAISFFVNQALFFNTGRRKN